MVRKSQREPWLDNGDDDDDGRDDDSDVILSSGFLIMFQIFFVCVCVDLNSEFFFQFLFKD